MNRNQLIPLYWDMGRRIEGNGKGMTEGEME